MRIHPADTPPQRGEFAWSCYWDRKFEMSLNIFADSAWNDGNSRKNDVWPTGAFAKPENPPISFVISFRSSVCPSVRFTYQRGFDWSTLREIWYWNLL
jgi:hypothetical protein